MSFIWFCLMIRRPPRATRTDTLFPSTTLFRSRSATVPVGCRVEQVPHPLGVVHRAAPDELRAVRGVLGGARGVDREDQRPASFRDAGLSHLPRADRKSTRLNSCH